MPKLPVNNRAQRRALLAEEPDAQAKAEHWMRTQLMVSVRELEARFPGTNVTVIVSMPGCGRFVGEFPKFSHATSADAIDQAAVVRALNQELQQ